MSPTTSCVILKKIKLDNFEKIDIKLWKKGTNGHFSQNILSPTSLESKLETGDNCAEFFCCRLKGPQKEITGYEYRVPAAPHFLYMGAESW